MSALTAVALISRFGIVTNTTGGNLLEAGAGISAVIAVNTVIIVRTGGYTGVSGTVTFEIIGTGGSQRITGPILATEGGHGITGAAIVATGI